MTTTKTTLLNPALTDRKDNVNPLSPKGNQPTLQSVLII